jgi:hypothetical protein
MATSKYGGFDFTAFAKTAAAKNPTYGRAPVNVAPLQTQESKNKVLSGYNGKIIPKINVKALTGKVVTPTLGKSTVTSITPKKTSSLYYSPKAPITSSSTKRTPFGLPKPPVVSLGGAPKAPITSSSTKRTPFGLPKPPVVSLGGAPKAPVSSSIINLPKVPDEVKELITIGMNDPNPIIRQKAEEVLKERIDEEIKYPSTPKIIGVPEIATNNNTKKYLLIGGAGLVFVFLLFLILKK